MRFTTAWARVITENITLKVILIALSIVTVVLCVVTSQLALREPLIVERACQTKAIQAGSTKHTSQEIEAFLKEALALRFNSDAVASRDLLSNDEFGFKVQEQKSFEQKNIKQRVIVVAVDNTKNPVVVDTDRILSVGTIRSAFAFPLAVRLSTVQRTESNPYGLLLEKVDQVKEAKK